MKPGKLVFAAKFGDGLIALDVHGCLWLKQSFNWDWERLETPYEQHERKVPGWQKSVTKRHRHKAR